MPGAPNRAKVRGHPPKAQSEIGLVAVIRETARLWRKRGLDYDQTKYVVEHVRRDLALEAPRERRRSVDRLDRFEVERLIEAAYRTRSRHGLMIKTLFLTGARVSEFVQVRVEDLHLDSDPPQIHIVHAKGGASRYVPILPSLAQELRTHLQARRRGYLMDRLMEHETELDPRTVYTDTHGYTEVVMATAGLLGKSLAPRIARMHEQTLYKLDRSRHYTHLDPILDGTIKPNLVRRAWDETVRVVASIQARTASPSLILHRLGSYARQHSVHQALNEIGRVDRTIHILRTIDEEEYRRRQGRELNKGEAAHDLSRFLFFGKQGELRRPKFRRSVPFVQLPGRATQRRRRLEHHPHRQAGQQLRAEGRAIDDATLALTTPLMHKHLNPFGRYHFDLARMRQSVDGSR